MPPAIDLSIQSDSGTHLTQFTCPHCGAKLFYCAGEVWCSRQGSSEQPGCSYGVITLVTLQQHQHQHRRLTKAQDQKKEKEIEDATTQQRGADPANGGT